MAAAAPGQWRIGAQAGLVGGPGLRSAASPYHVDDDYCASCDNDGHTWGYDAYDSIAAAVAAADDAGDTIYVHPGAYEAFQIGAGKSNLTIQGDHADAVFVDAGGGTYGIKLSDVDSVTLTNLTVRNAERGVWLDEAGLGGHQNPDLRITLDHVLVYDCHHALYTDRSSTVAVNECTLAGTGQSGRELIRFDTANPDTSLHQWSQRADVPSGISKGGALLYGNDRVYALPGGGSSHLLRYYRTTNSWSNVGTTPRPVVRACASAMDSSGDLWLLRGSEFGGFTSRVTTILARSSTNIEVGGQFGRSTWDGDEWNQESSSSHHLITTHGSYTYYMYDDTLVRVDAQGQSLTIAQAWIGLDMGTLRDVAFYGDDLFIGGDFEAVGYWDDAWGYVKYPANNIVRWNPTNGFSRLGNVDYDGVLSKFSPSANIDCDDYHYVNALLLDGDDLYVGFTGSLRWSFLGLRADAALDYGKRRPGADNTLTIGDSYTTGFFARLIIDSEFGPVTPLLDVLYSSGQTRPDVEARNEFHVVSPRRARRGALSRLELLTLNNDEYGWLSLTRAPSRPDVFSELVTTPRPLTLSNNDRGLTALAAAIDYQPVGDKDAQGWESFTISAIVAHALSTTRKDRSLGTEIVLGLSLEPVQGLRIEGVGAVLIPGSGLDNHINNKVQNFFDMSSTAETTSPLYKFALRVSLQL